MLSQIHRLNWSTVYINLKTLIEKSYQKLGSLLGGSIFSFRCYNGSNILYKGMKLNAER